MLWSSSSSLENIFKILWSSLFLSLSEKAMIVWFEAGAFGWKTSVDGSCTSIFELKSSAAWWENRIGLTLKLVIYVVFSVKELMPRERPLMMSDFFLEGKGGMGGQKSSDIINGWNGENSNTNQSIFSYDTFFLPVSTRTYFATIDSQVSVSVVSRWYLAINSFSSRMKEL